MRSVSGYSEPEQSLQASSASFPTIMNRVKTMAGSHINSAAGAADLNAWASTPDKMTHGGKHAGVSEDQILYMSLRTESLIIKIRRDKLVFLIKVKTKVSVDITRQEEMRDMFNNLVKETIHDVLTTA